MRKFKFLFSMIMSLIILCSCEGVQFNIGTQGEQGIQGEKGEPGKDGYSPVITIGDNGNWFIDGIDTGVAAQGEKGEIGPQGQPGSDGKDGTDGIEGKTPYIGENGNWWIGDTDTGVKAQGDKGNDGQTPLFRINDETLEWEVSYDNGNSWVGLGYKADVSKDTGFKDLKFSIIGDSISTCVNASNGLAANTTNSTIKNGAVYYTEGRLGVYQSDTWWQQVADKLGGRVLVNNSWSGSRVYADGAGTVGAYVDRCVQLHDDTGLNAGEEPDIIFVYLGTNDCTVYNEYSLGDYELIDFNNLIQKTEEEYKYLEPKTASEAYAIMLHKMIKRYPDAEVYCMTPLQRLNPNQTYEKILANFANSICKIANRFGAYTVDLYNDSGIVGNSDSFETYITDNSLHPGCAGMDAITNTVLSSLYSNSKYAPINKKTYTINYDTDAIILEGRKYATLEDEEFSCTIKKKNGYSLNINVFMNGENITDFACKDNEVIIQKVTGNITITAEYEKINREPLSFRFKTIDNSLTSITTNGYTENIVTKEQGAIVDGEYNNAIFSLNTEIELLHNNSWIIEWRFKGNPSMLLLSAKKTSEGNINGNYYLFVNKMGFIAMGERKNSNYDNYAALYDQNYHNEYYTYKLMNVITEDGSNMIYLYIDGVEVGPLDKYYTSLVNMNQSVNWVNGKDFYFSYIGTTNHPISGCYLDYIQIIENAK